MFRCDDESERCNASDQPDRLSGSSRHMLRSTTLSTSVAISPRLQRSVGSASRPSRHGVLLWALLPEGAFICDRLDRTQQRDKPLERAPLGNTLVSFEQRKTTYSEGNSVRRSYAPC